MVIGKTFAWGHIPKTGGDATLALFNLFPDLIDFADPYTTHLKHESFGHRLDQIAGKKLYLNIRRLPTWILSMAIHHSRHGKYPDYKPTEIWTSEEMAECRLAEGYLNGITMRQEHPVEGYFRTERLGEDFLAFISGHTSVSDEMRREILNFPKINATDYQHDIWQWFTQEQVDRLYENNPTWAKIERRMYGELMYEGKRAAANGGLKIALHTLPPDKSRSRTPPVEVPSKEYRRAS